MDVTGFNIDRFQPYQLNPRYRAERTVETLGMVYQAHFPGRSMESARGIKRSPIHDRLVEQGAYFRDVSGWEGADWFAGPGVEPHVGELSWGRQSWFDTWAAEHRAVREGVGLMDMSFMSKLLVQGADAGRLLDRVSANAVDGEPGVITYTQWLNEGGTIEADLTVTKLADDRFMVIASDNALGHVQSWLQRHTGDDRAYVTDVTSSLAQINVQGPRSRELLQSITSVDLSNAAFPFRAARDIDLGLRAGPVRAHHVPRRARLRAVRAGGAGDARLRAARRGRCARGDAAHGPEGAGQPAHGEGLPRLRPRHRQHRLGPRGGPGFRGRPRQARRLHRP